MIRLQTSENDIDDILQGDAPRADTNDENGESPPQSISIENFSTEVFKTLLSKQVAPLPLNYQTYFETLLNTKDIEFQKKIHELMEAADDHSDDERNITFEKSIHSAFANTRDIIKCTSSIYKNLVIMNDIETRWSADLESDNPSLCKRAKISNTKLTTK